MLFVSDFILPFRCLNWNTKKAIIVPTKRCERAVAVLQGCRSTDQRERNIIMYNHHLDTFIQVADSGSFLKAADKLYISANAVTKQINLLESHLDVKLFHRSTQGLTLTEAGKLIYTEAKKMIRHSNTVLQKAHEMENRQDHAIRIGVSLMNPADILLKQWQHAAKLHPNFHLEIIPFEDTVPAFLEVLDNLGTKIDMLSCPYETSYWGDRYNSFYLCDLPLCVTCSKMNPLADKEILSLENLHGKTLLLCRREVSNYTTPVWNEIEAHHPQIHLKGIDYSDINQFNQLVSSDEFLLSAECWKGVHPLLTTLPVDWDYTMPYGLIYSKNPSKELLQFLMTVGQMDE